ncbi:hypothetical protein BGZ65_010461, partial [Modicella reniformis]
MDMWKNEKLPRQPDLLSSSSNMTPHNEFTSSSSAPPLNASFPGPAVSASNPLPSSSSYSSATSALSKAEEKAYKKELKQYYKTAKQDVKEQEKEVKHQAEELKKELKYQASELKRELSHQAKTIGHTVKAELKYLNRSFNGVNDIHTARETNTARIVGVSPSLMYAPSSNIPFPTVTPSVTVVSPATQIVHPGCSHMSPVGQLILQHEQSKQERRFAHRHYKEQKRLARNERKKQRRIEREICGEYRHARVRLPLRFVGLATRVV